MPESSREGTPLGPHSSVHYGEVENAAGLYVAGIEPGLCVRLRGCVLVEVRMQETGNQIGDVGAGGGGGGGGEFRTSHFLLRQNS